MAAQARRQPVREWQQRVRLERKRPRRGLHEPAAPDTTQLRGERGPTRGRDMLDNARADHEVELVIGERQALRWVGLHEDGPGIVRVGQDVEARDVQLGLERAQAQAPATHVQDRGPAGGLHTRQGLGDLFPQMYPRTQNCSGFLMAISNQLIDTHNDS